MINVRRSNDRGHFNHGWLDTYHTFSFADYYDPQHMAFRSLRVINEDVVAPGQGFGMHPHRDMEIITYVLSGALEHRDNIGNRGLIKPGEVQYMAAGSGIMHGEFNPSQVEPVHLMQIWIMPNKSGVAPHYEQRPFPSLANAGKLTLLASADGRDGSIGINQDAALFAATLRPSQPVIQKLQNGRSAWLQVLRGDVDLNGEALHAGDGAAITDETELKLAATSESEVLLFDLA